MAFGHLASSTAKSVASRAVHVKIHPRPSTITESREIVRVMERFGEVVVFKNLKYEPQAPAPNTAIAIYRNEESATRAMKSSPVRFMFGDLSNIQELGTCGEGGLIGDATTVTPGAMPTQKGDGLIDEELGNTKAISSSKSRYLLQAEADEKAITDLRGNSSPDTSFASIKPTSNIKPFDPPSELSSINPPLPTPLPSSTPHHPGISSIPAPREVSLYIQSSGLNHAAYIARQGYYWGFQPDDSTIMYDDLRNRVPMPGLADLRLDVEETPIRTRMRKESKGRTMALRGLGELWRKGQEAKAGENQTGG